ncbi:hypothetical protein E2C01_037248 [Portunus trituberculatus]|uniref:Uncharacterized protein n=1 Tax=Portunus trituberculatus TaxID=210409 RepID=A0A5B7FF35_PORTR|nr:hypothetical protein [Portunus trituberculatus]
MARVRPPTRAAVSRLCKMKMFASGSECTLHLKQRKQKNRSSEPAGCTNTPRAELWRGGHHHHHHHHLRDQFVGRRTHNGTLAGHSGTGGIASLQCPRKERKVSTQFLSTFS